MNKKQFVIATLFVVILLSVAFIPISGQQDVREYDPWYDMNDDGKIDIKDIASAAIKFGTTGTPINKTALLLDLLARVKALENQSQFLPTPAYDSGWIGPMGPNQIITLAHNLGTEEVVVYMIGKGDFLGSTGVHQVYYGDKGGYNYGAAWWGLNATYITIGRNGDMIWDFIRVMIWKIPEP